MVCVASCTLREVLCGVVGLKWLPGVFGMVRGVVSCFGWVIVRSWGRARPHVRSGARFRRVPHHIKKMLARPGY